MTLDRELVTRKSLLMAADLDPLRVVLAKGLDPFLSSPLDQAVVERLLERTVTRMIDINYHIITASGHPPPPDYHASFLRLHELGIVDRDFAERIARSAGLRNRLVHDYDDIDPRKIFEALESALRDVPRYLKAVREHVERALSD